MNQRCNGSGRFNCATGLVMRCCFFMGSCSGCEWPGFSSHDDRARTMKDWLPKLEREQVQRLKTKG